MAVIETKYSIGDVVWHANTTTQARMHPCPDCMGSRIWSARSPAGGEFTFACPRCAEGYQSDRNLNLRYGWMVATAGRLTIGQVRPCAGSGGEHEYMCLETGVGSGALYREDRLFLTKDEAVACGAAMADLHNADPKGWVAKQYAATLKICDYQLKDAVMEGARADARRSMHRVGYLIEDIQNAETLDEVRDLVEGWRNRESADDGVPAAEVA